MPPPDRQPIPAVDASSEIYLHLQSRRAGKIKGEAKALEHVDDIEVTGWQWGAQASSALGSPGSTGRPACSYRALTVYKRLDTATTALLWALARNDDLREVRLTMRRPGLAGGAQDDVFTVTLNDARVTGLQYGAAVDGSTCEVVTIESKVVQAQYRTGKPRMPVATLPAAPARRAPASQAALTARAPDAAVGAPGGQVASDADIDRALGRAALWAAGKIDQFQQTELGRTLQALPPEGAAIGGLKAGLSGVGRLAAKGAAAAAETSFKTAHYASRLEAAGVDIARAEAAVDKEVNAMRASLATNADVVGRLTVDGVTLEYRARLLADGTVNVGTLFPMK